MNVALHQLRAFLAVARHSSFSRGAEEVGMSQSAISLSIRKLETELGVKLLDRTTRQVRLTAVGETLVASSTRLISEIDSALRELRDIGEQRRGRAAIACVPSVARSLMPGCIAYCAEHWPNVSLVIEDVAASEVIRKVARGETEFGLTSGTIGNAELSSEALMEDPFCVVFRKDDPLAKRKQVRWADLSGRKLIMLNSTSGSHQIIGESLRQAGIEADTVLELAQPSSVHGMIEGGIGIAVVPLLAAPRPSDLVLKTRPLHAPQVSRTILLVSRRDHSLSPAASAVWNALHYLYGQKRERGAGAGPSA